jgi:hypothetical protein
MTTYELAERLARRLKKERFDKLSMAEVMDIVEAINAGLQECYELLPPWMRRTTVSLTLAAPATLNISVVNGSVDLADGAGVFTEAQIGRSVVVAGDPNWNEVQSATKLLDEYQGSTGVKSATVYCDSIYSDVTNFEGLTSHPRFADSREELIQFNARAAELPAEIGEPRYYWMEPAGSSLGATPAVYLRFFPAPDVAYVLRVDMEFRPSVISYATLNQAATIPLAANLLHRALLPLCELQLLRSPQWRDRSIAADVKEAAQAARAFLMNQRTSAAVPSNRVFTPAGY